MISLIFRSGNWPLFFKKYDIKVDISFSLNIMHSLSTNTKGKIYDICN